MALITRQVKHLEAEFHAAKLPTNPAVDWSDDAYDRPYQKHEVTPPPPPSPPPDASLGPDAEPPAQASLISLRMHNSGQPRGTLGFCDGHSAAGVASGCSSSLLSIKGRLNLQDFMTPLSAVQTVGPAPAPAPAPSVLQQRTGAQKQLPPWDIAANGQEVSKSASLTPCTPSSYLLHVSRVGPHRVYMPQPAWPIASWLQAAALMTTHVHAA